MDKFREVKKIERPWQPRNRNLRYRTPDGLDFFLQSILASDPLCRRRMLEKHVDRTSIYRYGIRPPPPAPLFLLRYFPSFSFTLLCHLVCVFLNSIGKENVGRALFYTHIHTDMALSFSVSVLPSLSLALDRQVHLRTSRSSGE